MRGRQREGQGSDAGRRQQRQGQRHRPAKVVIVTTFDLDEYVYGALRSGAVGFILKDAGPALLVEAVRAADGEALISPSITVRLPTHLAQKAPPQLTNLVHAQRSPSGKPMSHVW
jgi:DNA-binding NarL/FixJ family response regulator